MMIHLFPDDWTDAVETVTIDLPPESQSLMTEERRKELALIMAHHSPEGQKHLPLATGWEVREMCENGSVVLERKYKRQHQPTFEYGWGTQDDWYRCPVPREKLLRTGAMFLGGPDGSVEAACYIGVETRSSYRHGGSACDVWERFRFDGDGLPKWLNVYIVTREYAGPEEGGRWIDISTWIDGKQVHPDAASNRPLIVKFVDRLKRKHANKEFGNISSVLGGQQIAVRLEFEKAQSDNQDADRSYQ